MMGKSNKLGVSGQNKNSEFFVEGRSKSKSFVTGAK